MKPQHTTLSGADLQQASGSDVVLVGKQTFDLVRSRFDDNDAFLAEVKRAHREKLSGSTVSVKIGDQLHHFNITKKLGGKNAGKLLIAARGKGEEIRDDDGPLKVAIFC